MSLFQSFKKTNRFHPVLRITSFLVACIFSWDTIVWAAPPVPQNPNSGKEALRDFLKDFSVPESLGHIESRFIPADLPSNTSQPLIIHIQDAHAHPEAQKNIEALLGYLAENAEVQTVALEAAFGKIDPRIFNFFSVSEANHALVEYLASLGELTGAELFAAKQKGTPLELHGVEDETLYKKSYLLFRKIKSLKSKTAERLASYKEALEQLENTLLNEELQSFVRQRKAWESQKDEALNYFRILKELSKKNLGFDLAEPRRQFEWPNLTRLMKADEKEPGLQRESALLETKNLAGLLDQTLPKGKKKDFLASGLHLLAELSPAGPFEEWLRLNTAYPEIKTVRHFFEDLHRALTEKNLSLLQYPQFLTRGGIMILREEIDASFLFKEIGILEERIAQKLAKTENEKKILALASDLLLLEKLLALNLTREDAGAYQKRQSFLTPHQIKERFRKALCHSRESGNPASFKSLDPRLKRSGMTNYPNPSCAQRLFELPPFSEKLLKAAGEFYHLSRQRDRTLLENTLRLAQAKKSKRPFQPTVLIAGGFHTQGLTDLLKFQKIPHLVISPKMTHFEGERLYEKVMMGENAKLNNLLMAPSSALFRAYLTYLVQHPERARPLGLREDAQRDLLIRAILEGVIPALRKNKSAEDGVERTIQEALQKHPEIFGGSRIISGADGKYQVAIWHGFEGKEFILDGDEEKEGALAANDLWIEVHHDPRNVQKKYEFFPSVFSYELINDQEIRDLTIQLVESGYDQIYLGQVWEAIQDKFGDSSDPRTLLSSVLKEALQEKQIFDKQHPQTAASFITKSQFKLTPDIFNAVRDFFQGRRGSVDKIKDTEIPEDEIWIVFKSESQILEEKKWDWQKKAFQPVRRSEMRKSKERSGGFFDFFQEFFRHPNPDKRQIANPFPGRNFFEADNFSLGQPHRDEPLSRFRKFEIRRPQFASKLNAVVGVPESGFFFVGSELGDLRFFHSLGLSPFLAEVLFRLRHIPGRNDSNDSAALVTTDHKKIAAVTGLAINQVKPAAAFQNKGALVTRFLNLFGIHTVPGNVIDVANIPFKRANAQKPPPSSEAESIDVYTGDVKLQGVRSEVRSLSHQEGKKKRGRRPAETTIEVTEELRRRLEAVFQKALSREGSLNRIAEKADVYPDYLSRIVRGIMPRTTLELLERVEKALGVDLDLPSLPKRYVTLSPKAREELRSAIKNKSNREKIQIAQHIGISLQSLYNLANGRQGIANDRLEKLEKILGIQISRSEMRLPAGEAGADAADFNIARWVAQTYHPERVGNALSDVKRGEWAGEGAGLLGELMERHDLDWENDRTRIEAILTEALAAAQNRGRRSELRYESNYWSAMLSDRTIFTENPKESKKLGGEVYETSDRLFRIEILEGQLAIKTKGNGGKEVIRIEEGRGRELLERFLEVTESGERTISFRDHQSYLPLITDLHYDSSQKIFTLKLDPRTQFEPRSVDLKVKGKFRTFLVTVRFELSPLERAGPLLELLKGIIANSKTKGTAHHSQKIIDSASELAPLLKAKPGSKDLIKRARTLVESDGIIDDLEYRHFYNQIEDSLAAGDAIRELKQNPEDEFWVQRARSILNKTPAARSEMRAQRSKALEKLRQIHRDLAPVPLLLRNPAFHNIVGPTSGNRRNISSYIKELEGENPNYPKLAIYLASIRGGIQDRAARIQRYLDAIEGGAAEIKVGRGSLSATVDRETLVTFKANLEKTARVFQSIDQNLSEEIKILNSLRSEVREKEVTEKLVQKLEKYRDKGNWLAFLKELMNDTSASQLAKDAGYSVGTVKKWLAGDKPDENTASWIKGHFEKVYQKGSRREELFNLFDELFMPGKAGRAGEKDARSLREDPSLKLIRKFGNKVRGRSLTEAAAYLAEKAPEYLKRDIRVDSIRRYFLLHKKLMEELGIQRSSQKFGSRTPGAQKLRRSEMRIHQPADQVKTVESVRTDSITLEDENGKDQVEILIPNSPYRIRIKFIKRYVEGNKNPTVALEFFAPSSIEIGRRAISKNRPISKGETLTSPFRRNFWQRDKIYLKDEYRNYSFPLIRVHIDENAVRLTSQEEIFIPQQRSEIRNERRDGDKRREVREQKRSSPLDFSRSEMRAEETEEDTAFVEAFSNAVQTLDLEGVRILHALRSILGQEMMEAGMFTSLTAQLPDLKFDFDSDLSRVKDFLVALHVTELVKMVAQHAHNRIKRNKGILTLVALEKNDRRLKDYFLSLFSRDKKSKTLRNLELVRRLRVLLTSAESPLGLDVKKQRLSLIPSYEAKIQAEIEEAVRTLQESLQKKIKEIKAEDARNTLIGWAEDGYADLVRTAIQGASIQQRISLEEIEQVEIVAGRAGRSEVRSEGETVTLSDEARAEIENRLKQLFEALKPYRYYEVQKDWRYNLTLWTIKILSLKWLPRFIRHLIWRISNFYSPFLNKVPDEVKKKYREEIDFVSNKILDWRRRNINSQADVMLRIGFTGSPWTEELAAPLTAQVQEFPVLPLDYYSGFGLEFPLILSLTPELVRSLFSNSGKSSFTPAARKAFGEAEDAFRQLYSEDAAEAEQIVQESYVAQAASTLDDLIDILNQDFETRDLLRLKPIIERLPLTPSQREGLMGILEEPLFKSQPALLLEVVEGRPIFRYQFDIRPLGKDKVILFFNWLGDVFKPMSIGEEYDWVALSINSQEVARYSRSETRTQKDLRQVTRDQRLEASSPLSPLSRSEVRNILSLIPTKPVQTIVVVESKQALLAKYRSLFGRLNIPGVEIEYFSDGVSALEFIQENQKKAGLLVTNLPIAKLRGDQLISRLRNELKLSFPVIVASDRGFGEVKIKEYGSNIADAGKLQPYDLPAIRILVQRSLRGNEWETFSNAPEEFFLEDWVEETLFGAELIVSGTFEQPLETVTLDSDLRPTHHLGKTVRRPEEFQRLAAMPFVAEVARLKKEYGEKAVLTPGRLDLAAPIRQLKIGNRAYPAQLQLDSGRISKIRILAQPLDTRPETGEKIAAKVARSEVRIGNKILRNYLRDSDPAQFERYLLEHPDLKRELRPEQLKILRERTFSKNPKTLKTIGEEMKIHANQAGMIEAEAIERSIEYVALQILPQLRRDLEEESQSSRAVEDLLWLTSELESRYTRKKREIDNDVKAELGQVVPLIVEKLMNDSELLIRRRSAWAFHNLSLFDRDSLLLARQEILPKLAGAFESSDDGHVSVIILEVLGEMGPAAKDALKSIEKFRNGSDLYLKKLVEAVIQQVSSRSEVRADPRSEMGSTEDKVEKLLWLFIAKPSEVLSWLESKATQQELSYAVGILEAALTKSFLQAANALKMTRESLDRIYQKYHWPDDAFPNQNGEFTPKYSKLSNANRSFPRYVEEILKDNPTPVTEIGGTYPSLLESVLGKNWREKLVQILQILPQVPRHLYAPSYFGAAYLDQDDQAALNPSENIYANSGVPIGYGQTISAPALVIAILAMADFQGDEKVLEVGAGRGWSASLISKLARKVFATEIVPELTRYAQETARKMKINNLQFIQAEENKLGYPAEGPYDVILVWAGSPEETVHPDLTNQLAEGGKIVIPLYDAKFSQRFQRNYYRFKIFEKTRNRELIEKHSLMVTSFVPLVLPQARSEVRGAVQDEISGESVSGVFLANREIQESQLPTQKELTPRISARFPLSLELPPSPVNPQKDKEKYQPKDTPEQKNSKDKPLGVQKVSSHQGGEVYSDERGKHLSNVLALPPRKVKPDSHRGEYGLNLSKSKIKFSERLNLGRWPAVAQVKGRRRKVEGGSKQPLQPSLPGLARQLAPARPAGGGGRQAGIVGLRPALFRSEVRNEERKRDPVKQGSDGWLVQYLLLSVVTTLLFLILLPRHPLIQRLTKPYRQAAEMKTEKGKEEVIEDNFFKVNVPTRFLPYFKVPPVYPDDELKDLADLVLANLEKELGEPFDVTKRKHVRDLAQYFHLIGPGSEHPSLPSLGEEDIDLLWNQWKWKGESNEAFVLELFRMWQARQREISRRSEVRSEWDKDSSVPADGEDEVWTVAEMRKESNRIRWDAWHEWIKNIHHGFVRFLGIVAVAAYGTLVVYTWINWIAGGGNVGPAIVFTGVAAISGLLVFGMTWLHTTGHNKLRRFLDQFLGRLFGIYFAREASLEERRGILRKEIFRRLGLSFEFQLTQPLALVLIQKIKPYLAEPFQSEFSPTQFAFLEKIKDLDEVTGHLKSVGGWRIRRGFRRMDSALEDYTLDLLGLIEETPDQKNQILSRLVFRRLPKLEKAVDALLNLAARHGWTSFARSEVRGGATRVKVLSGVQLVFYNFNGNRYKAFRFKILSPRASEHKFIFEPSTGFEFLNPEIPGPYGKDEQGWFMVPVRKHDSVQVREAGQVVMTLYLRRVEPPIPGKRPSPRIFLDFQGGPPEVEFDWNYDLAQKDLDNLIAVVREQFEDSDDLVSKLGAAHWKIRDRKREEAMETLTEILAELEGAAYADFKSRVRIVLDLITPFRSGKKSADSPRSEVRGKERVSERIDGGETGNNREEGLRRLPPLSQIKPGKTSTMWPSHSPLAHQGVNQEDEKQPRQTSAFQQTNGEFIRSQDGLRIKPRPRSLKINNQINNDYKTIKKPQAKNSGSTSQASRFGLQAPSSRSEVRADGKGRRKGDVSKEKSLHQQALDVPRKPFGKIQSLLGLFWPQKRELAVFGFHAFLFDYGQHFSIERIQLSSLQGQPVNQHLYSVMAGGVLSFGQKIGFRSVEHTIVSSGDRIAILPVFQKKFGRFQFFGSNLQAASNKFLLLFQRVIPSFLMFRERGVGEWNSAEVKIKGEISTPSLAIGSKAASATLKRREGDSVDKTTAKSVSEEDEAEPLALDPNSITDSRVSGSRRFKPSINFRTARRSTLESRLLKAADFIFLSPIRPNEVYQPLSSVSKVPTRGKAASRSEVRTEEGVTETEQHYIERELKIPLKDQLLVRVSDEPFEKTPFPPYILLDFFRMWFRNTPMLRLTFPKKSMKAITQNFKGEWVHINSKKNFGIPIGHKLLIIPRPGIPDNPISREISIVILEKINRSFRVKIASSGPTEVVLASEKLAEEKMRVGDRLIPVDPRKYRYGSFTLDFLLEKSYQKAPKKFARNKEGIFIPAAAPSWEGDMHRKFPGGRSEVRAKKRKGPGIEELLSLLEGEDPDPEELIKIGFTETRAIVSEETSFGEAANEILALLDSADETKDSDRGNSRTKIRNAFLLTPPILLPIRAALEDLFVSLGGESEELNRPEKKPAAKSEVRSKHVVSFHNPKELRGSLEDYLQDVLIPADEMTAFDASKFNSDSSIVVHTKFPFERFKKAEAGAKDAKQYQEFAPSIQAVNEFLAQAFAGKLEGQPADLLALIRLGLLKVRLLIQPDNTFQFEFVLTIFGETTQKSTAVFTAQSNPLFYKLFKFVIKAAMEQVKSVSGSIDPKKLKALNDSTGFGHVILEKIRLSRSELRRDDRSAESSLPLVSQGGGKVGEEFERPGNRPPHLASPFINKGEGTSFDRPTTMTLRPSYDRLAEFLGPNRPYLSARWVAIHVAGGIFVPIPAELLPSVLPFLKADLPYLLESLNDVSISPYAFNVIADQSRSRGVPAPDINFSAGQDAPPTRLQSAAKEEAKTSKAALDITLLDQLPGEDDLIYLGIAEILRGKPTRFIRLAASGSSQQEADQINNAFAREYPGIAGQFRIYGFKGRRHFQNALQQIISETHNTARASLGSAAVGSLAEFYNWISLSSRSLKLLGSVLAPIRWLIQNNLPPSPGIQTYLIQRKLDLARGLLSAETIRRLEEIKERILRAEDLVEEDLQLIEEWFQLTVAAVRTLYRSA